MTKCYYLLILGWFMGAEFLTNTWPMCIFYLRNLPWPFSFKEIKEYTIVIKSTVLQRNILIQILYSRSSNCLSFGKKWFEKLRYDIHTHSATFTMLYHMTISALFYTILLMGTATPQFLNGNVHNKKWSNFSVTIVPVITDPENSFVTWILSFRKWLQIGYFYSEL